MNNVLPEPTSDDSSVPAAAFWAVLIGVHVLVTGLLAMLVGALIAIDVLILVLVLEVILWQRRRVLAMISGGGVAIKEGWRSRMTQRAAAVNAPPALARGGTRSPSQLGNRPPASAKGDADVQGYSQRLQRLHGQLIPCHVCNKNVADTALSCPHCGSVQTPEGREQGKQRQAARGILAALFACVLLIPFFLIVFAVLNGTHDPRAENATPSNTADPFGPDFELRARELHWDPDQLRRDIKETRDPNKTFFIPLDGSQPRVVPNPYPQDEQ
jgi:hypothetical protein